MRWKIANEAHSAKLAIILYTGIYGYIRNAHKTLRNCPTLFVKTTDFQLVFNFEQMRTVTIFGEHGVMAHIS